MARRYFIFVKTSRSFAPSSISRTLAIRACSLPWSEAKLGCFAHQIPSGPGATKAGENLYCLFDRGSTKGYFDFQHGELVTPGQRRAPISPKKRPLGLRRSTGRKQRFVQPSETAHYTSPKHLPFSTERCATVALGDPGSLGVIHTLERIEQ
ncbi:hypothetical protein [Burkholderia cenocepacia]|uniref:hypothetical protein n=1 Tax=Burkholderia cenocepacia TaxID=95486 RepID=UPI002874A250|nr:hypothetical protein [Burkholderia cenocepacia]MDS0802836.1 hypothetical protein [Burkholderia cenocepacia]